MATVGELAGLLQSSMQSPAPPGPGICPICRGFPGPGYTEDAGCGFTPKHLDAVVPISYAPGLGQLHTALRGYKDDVLPAVRRTFRLRLGAVLWKFLARHEPCVAVAAGTDSFDMVTVVPSKTKAQDQRRSALRELVGTTCGHTSARYRRLLSPTDAGTTDRLFDARRYEATEALDGQSVLLIDDTWTSGASAQSAAYALKQAGAATVALVVIGRFIRPDYQDHRARLEEHRSPFDWDHCAAHQVG